MRFRALIELTGKTAAGFEVPPKVVESLGSGKHPPVRVTMNGHTYRTSVGTVGGRFMVGVSAENRKSAGLAGGDWQTISAIIEDELCSHGVNVTVYDLP